MKALILNGSPRKGNSTAAAEILKKGLSNIKDLSVEEIRADDLSVSPCIACGACGCEDNCVFDDDTNEIIGKICDADTVIFVTPVYWWGVTAQLKVVIDKLYSRVTLLKDMDKKVGLIVIGEAEQDDPQYKIIPEQFRCISEYLGWDMRFAGTYTAHEIGDLRKNEAALKEIEALWQKLR